MLSLRQRNRLNAMRTTQRAALDLFSQRGFAAVTVGDIAAAVGMAPSTVYRHFGTKEGIILWDEHDPAIDDALGRRLATEPPLAAIRGALREELGAGYDDDEFQLARISYIYATEQLHAAAVEADLRDREELTAALEQVMTKANRQAGAMIAGAALLALDLALERWQADGGRRSLVDRIDETFDQLEHLATLR